MKRLLLAQTVFSGTYVKKISRTANRQFKTTEPQNQRAKWFLINLWCSGLWSFSESLRRTAFSSCALLFKLMLVVSMASAVAACSDEPQEECGPKVVMATEAERQDIKTYDNAGYYYGISYDEEEQMWRLGGVYECMLPQITRKYYITGPESDYSIYKGKYVWFSGKGSLYRKVIYPGGNIVEYYTLVLDYIRES